MGLVFLEDASAGVGLSVAPLRCTQPALSPVPGGSSSTWGSACGLAALQ